MSELTINGKIKSFTKIESGTSKVGKEWQKQSFIVANDGGYEGKEQIFCFDVFGTEKVENLTKFQKVGDEITVQFNIGTNEYNNPTKGLQYFTSLNAWRIEKLATAPAQEHAPVTSAELEEEPDDLPF